MSKDVDPIAYIDSYNVRWDSPSRDAGESMPCGGHDIGLNVWVEADRTGAGELLFYIDRAGSFDENNQMLKLGRVRVRLTPNPFTPDAPFRQELQLRQGCIEITDGDPQDEASTRIEVWVDAMQPAVHVEVHSAQPVMLEAGYENWRLGVREIPYDRRHPCASWVAYAGTVTTKPDTVDFASDGVLFYHRNRNDCLLIDHLIQQQGLGPVAEEIPDPQRNRTFGGLMRGPGLEPAGTSEGQYAGTPHRSWLLRSRAAQTTQRLDIVLHTAQSETLDEWLAGLHDTAAASAGVEAARLATRAWWAQFWERSHICLQPSAPDPADPAWQVGRNYHLFRYMLGCNRAGEYPTKFNGGLFIYDPGFVREDLANESADFRMWGGGSHTAQNQRLVYWPMLKSGDFDLMPPQFEYYRRALPGAEARTRLYWGHEGCSFTEQLENFGLPIGWNWGWLETPDPYHKRTPFSDPTECQGPWIRYLYLSQLEFALMILRYRQYSGLDITAYLPFIESAIRFFDVHYQWQHRINALRPLDENGHLVLFPSTACETYKDAMNPVDLVSGLQCTVEALLEIGGDLLSEETREYYRGLLDRIPPLSFTEREGKRIIAPAKSWAGEINVEIPQLYTVHPYERYGLGKPDLQVAIDTWRHGGWSEHQLSHVSWHQQAIFCALMGLTDDAAAYTLRKLSDSGRRFPAFWGPGHDWVPDHNWGGSGMIGLQEMLMQCDGRTIRLLPAWPADWEVEFKLHAPFNTVVEGRYAGGKLVNLQVTPPEREADIIMGAEG